MRRVKQSARRHKKHRRLLRILGSDSAVASAYRQAYDARLAALRKISHDGDRPGMRRWMKATSIFLREVGEALGARDAAHGRTTVQPKSPSTRMYESTRVSRPASAKIPASASVGVRARQSVRHNRMLERATQEREKKCTDASLDDLNETVISSNENNKAQFTSSVVRTVETDSSKRSTGKTDQPPSVPRIRLHHRALAVRSQLGVASEGSPQDSKDPWLTARQKAMAEFAAAKTAKLQLDQEAMETTIRPRLPGSNNQHSIKSTGRSARQKAAKKRLRLHYIHRAFAIHNSTFRRTSLSVETRYRLKPHEFRTRHRHLMQARRRFVVHQDKESLWNTPSLKPGEDSPLHPDTRSESVQANKLMSNVRGLLGKDSSVNGTTEEHHDGMYSPFRR